MAAHTYTQTRQPALTHDSINVNRVTRNQLIA